MLGGTYVQFSGALLFSLVFLFLWKQSGVVYFGYWSLAWAVESAAWLCTLLARITGSSRWLGAHSFFEFGFALSLVAAARVGSVVPAGRAWRSALRALYFFPAFLLVLELIGWERHNVYGALRSLVLSGIYFYTFRQLGFGVRKLFHFTLLALSMLYLQDALAYLFLILVAGKAPAWMVYMDYVSYYDLALKTTLAFSAMAMWIENQSDRLAQIGKELDRARREASREADLDYLTGLLNPDALRRRMDSGELFSGVAVVCDLDDFKSINDRFGHVVGDEVLRNVGNLIRSSIRSEDLAYRWGGDEFAILFQDQGMQLAQSRMLAVELRLHAFQIRGHGSMDIQFSWGAAEASASSFREILDMADREMYSLKQRRHGRARTSGFRRTDVPGSIVGDPHGYGAAE